MVKRSLKKIKIFIIHSSLQDKVVARHKNITDSLVAFIMDNIHVMWIHLLAVTSKRLSLDNFSTHFISELIWFGKLLAVISFKVIWGQLTARIFPGSSAYFRGRRARTLHSRVVDTLVSASPGCVYSKLGVILFSSGDGWKVRFSLDFFLLGKW